MNEIIRTWKHPSGRHVVLVYGDITFEDVDAIVNAANSQLKHGGGVAAAIAGRGGPVIQEESNELAPVKVGQAVLTGAGDLPAEHVIHAVGPRWGEGDEENKLGSAVKSALAIAEEFDLESISFPAISTGIFSFPVERAAPVILKSIRKHLDKHSHSSLRQVRVCLFNRQILDKFDEAWDGIFRDKVSPDGHEHRGS